MSGQVVTALALKDTPALNMQRGLIPMPKFANKIINDSFNTAWDDLGTRTVDRFILHRMLGTLNGTDEFFRTMGSARADFQRTGNAVGALTDYGIDNISGDVFNWNDPWGKASPGVSPNRSGWSSGPYNTTGTAFGDGKIWIEKFGVNAVNRNGLSWEIAGFQTDPFSDAAMKVTAQAIASTAHDKGIFYFDFPMVVADGGSFTVYHCEITGEDVKECPFDTVKAQTNALIAMAKEIMRLAQTKNISPTPPRFVQPKVPVQWKPHTDLVYPTDLPNGFIAMRRKWYASVETAQRATASAQGYLAGPNIAKGAELFGEYIVRAADKQLYAVLRTNHNAVEGARVLLKDLKAPTGSIFSL